MTVTHIHYLTTGDKLGPCDAMATFLALSSGGRHVLGPSAERLDLAEQVGPGSLSELLTSGRPLRAYSIANAYVFEEVA